MRRGTTPTITITLDGIETDLLDKIYVTFKTKCGCMMTKTNEDIEFDSDPNVIKIHLTESETLKMPKGDIDVQMRAVTKDGNAIATNIVPMSVKEILYEAHITDGG